MFCGKGLEQVTVLHRINEKGVPGIYACEKHIRNTDIQVDPEISDIINILTGN
jgi:hypothetical protein